MYLGSHSLVQPTNTTLVYLWQVESQLSIIAKCEPGSEIYTDSINVLQAVEEIGRLTLDHARDIGNISESTIQRGRQAGGRQGHGGRQSSQCHSSSRPPTSGQCHTPVPTSSWRPTSTQRPTSGSRHTPVPTSSRRHTPVPTSTRRHTPVHDHTMEEASQTTDEMCLDTAYDIGSMAHDAAGPSHTFPLTSSTAPVVVHGRDEMRFMPTPGMSIFLGVNSRRILSSWIQVMPWNERQFWICFDFYYFLYFSFLIYFQGVLHYSTCFQTTICCQ